MRRLLFAGSFLTLWLLAGGSAFAASEQRADIRVLRVLDGDTIEVVDADNQKQRVRLQGIDAPEGCQAYGDASRAALATMINGRQASVFWREHDRHGRILGRVVHNGIDANLAMLESGHAWYFRSYERDLLPSLRQEYDQAEQRARTNRVGLWSDRAPEPPWKFRKRVGACRY